MEQLILGAIDVKKTPKWFHVYFDNNAWSDLALRRRRGNFTVTDEHISLLKNSHLSPVLSGVNVGEASLLIPGNLPDGEKLLRLMMELSFPRLFSPASVFMKDIGVLTKGTTGRYFKPFHSKKDKDILLKEKEFYENPSANLQVFKDAADRYNTWKEQLRSSSLSDVQSIRQKLSGKRPPNLRKTALTEFLEGCKRSPKMVGVVTSTLKGIWISEPDNAAELVVANMERSRVIIPYLLCLFLMDSEYIDTGRNPKASDMDDALHYAMSGFCNFFVTGDRWLSSVLKKIDKSPDRIMDLVSFIKMACSGSADAALPV